MFDQDGANIFHHLFPIKLNILVLSEFFLSLGLLFFKLLLSLLVGYFSFNLRCSNNWIRRQFFGLSSLVLLNLSFEELALLFTIQVETLMVLSFTALEDLAIGSFYFLHRTSLSLLNSIILLKVIIIIWCQQRFSSPSLGLEIVRIRVGNRDIFFSFGRFRCFF